MSKKAKADAPAVAAEASEGAKKPAKGKKPAAKKAAKEAAPAKEAKARKPSRTKAPTLVEATPHTEEPTEENPAVTVTVPDVVEATAPAPAMTEEERELAALYGDLSSPASAHGEFSDHKTADEDRPMLPEINARDERKHHWQDRRDQRRRRRDERNQRRDGGGGGGGGGSGRDQPQQAQPQRPPQQSQHAQRPALPAPAPHTNGHANGPTSTVEHDAHGRVGTPLGDAANSVFSQLRNGQPLPVRQLAAMMRKRNLVEAEPEQLWPQLKAELLGDERSYRTLGLRPRIVYRGRDLFAPGPVAMSTTADAEAGVATALSRLAGATHRALTQRLARATPAGFERLIHAYLVAAGYREIDWVKRVGGISYASAVAPGIDRTVLISARSGDQPIDRRGIGELRVGVEAKNLVAGFLFSVRELADDAEAELERAGRSIAVVCGDQLIAALITAGIGVVSSAAPLHYVDDQLLDELLAG